MTVHLSRYHLYDAVWSVPPGKLARRLGLSIDQIKQACCLLDIPIPELAYWMRCRRGAEALPLPLPPSNGPIELWMGAWAQLEPPAPPVFWRDESLLPVIDIEILAGRKNKRLQCQALTEMQIPFAVNALGEPLVPVCAVEGSKAAARRQVKELQERLDRAIEKARRGRRGP